jgi:hypothetical protein
LANPEAPNFRLTHALAAGPKLGVTPAELPALSVVK